MEYLKVRWLHHLSDEPVLLYSELDSERYEIRKVEIYRNGRHDWADRESATGTTMLGELPIPSVEEIANQQQFSPEVVDREEFEVAYCGSSGVEALLQMREERGVLFWSPERMASV